VAGKASFNAAVPREHIYAARAAVHGEHDIVLHRTLVPGDALDTYSEAWSLRTTSSGARVVMRLEQRDAADRLAVEHWWTLFLVGVDLGDDGPDPPDHTFPEAARANPIATASVPIAVDQPRRYAEVSDDWSPGHFRAEVARAEGFPEVYLHGLCTMGMCSNAIVREAAGGDSTRVRRIAVRFASPTYLGRDLTVDMFRASGSAVAFEAQCAGATVVKHGWVELREDAP